jgi:hypothetical protein
MTRVTLEPLNARPEIPEVSPCGVDDVDASRRARALEPIDPGALGRAQVDVNANLAPRPRWRVAEIAVPDPKALDGRVEGLVSDILRALQEAHQTSDDSWTFTSDEATTEAPGEARESSSSSSLMVIPENGRAEEGPICFVERFPVFDVQSDFGKAKAQPWYDHELKTWTRDIFPVDPHRSKTREDVFILERWLDASVAEAKPETTSLQEMDLQKICDDALFAIQKTFESITTHVFFECRDRASLLRRVWMYNSRFLQARNAVSTSPILMTARREKREADVERKKTETEIERLRLDLRESQTSMEQMEMRHDTYRTEANKRMFSLIEKLRVVVNDDVDARDASAKACRRENALREEFMEAKKNGDEKKKNDVRTKWRVLAGSLRKQSALRRAKRAILDVARDVRDFQVTRAVVHGLAWETAIGTEKARGDSFESRFVGEREKCEALARKVSELELEIQRAREETNDAIETEREATREAVARGEMAMLARNDALSFARETREEIKTIREKLNETETRFAESREETRVVQVHLQETSAHVETAEEALRATRLELTSKSDALRSNEKILREARLAATSRLNAFRNLLAEVETEVSIADESEAVATDEKVVSWIESIDTDETSVEDRTLISVDARLASVSRAATRSLSEHRRERDRLLRQTFSLETRLAAVSVDASNSATLAATYKTRFADCDAVRETLDMKSRALEHRLKKRESALRNAQAERDRLSNSTVPRLSRDLDDALSEIDRLKKANVENGKKTEAVASEADSLEVQLIDAVVDHFVLETAHGALKVSERDSATAYLSERALRVREAEEAKERDFANGKILDEKRCELVCAESARDLLAKEVIHLEMDRERLRHGRDRAVKDLEDAHYESHALRERITNLRDRCASEKEKRDERDAFEFLTGKAKERDDLEREILYAKETHASLKSEYESARAALTATIDAHEEMRALVTSSTEAIETAREVVAESLRNRKKKRAERLFGRRDASTQCDERHKTCGRPIRTTVVSLYE